MDYFFVGIGGSGMMPLAMILAGQGASVAGSDRGLDQGRVPAKFAALQALGIRLFPQDGSGIRSAGQVVVASAAVEESVADIARATALGALRMTRAELNARLFNRAQTAIGVAGTSGKSTVTGMIGWLLHTLDREPTVMNGAVMKNFARPEAPFASALVGEPGLYVSEVDESDGSIALYTPRVAVVNNISLDHKSLDELRALFGAFAARAQTAVLNIGDAETAALAATLPPGRAYTVAIERPADLVAQALAPAADGTAFTIRERGGPAIPVSLRVPGRHNVANALAALGAVRALGIDLAEAAAALSGFAGLKRRFDVIGTAAGVTVIDDFAHNPDKLAATLDTLHATPGRLLLLFQPHGYGPLQVMRAELVAALAAHLAADDRLVLCDPAYFGGTVARTVTSADIVADLVATGAPARHIAERAEAAATLLAEARAGDRLVVMGARDDSLSQLAEDLLERLRARGEA